MKNFVLALVALFGVAVAAQACNPVTVSAAYNGTYANAQVVLGVVHPVVNTVTVVKQVQAYVPQTVTLQTVNAYANVAVPVQTKTVTRQVIKQCFVAIGH